MAIDGHRIGVPGYKIIEQHLSSNDIDESTKSSLTSSIGNLLSFVTERDSLALLSRSSVQYLLEEGIKDMSNGLIPSLEQTHIELLQALILFAGSGKPVPTSPRNTLRLWQMLSENISAYIEGSSSLPDQPSPEQIIVRRIRVHTIYYRNVFNSQDAQEVMPALLEKIDSVSRSRLGYSLMELSKAIFEVYNNALDGIDEYRKTIGSLLNDDHILDQIDKIRLRSNVADRAWRFTSVWLARLADLKIAGIQLSELAWTPSFIFQRSNLEQRFGTTITNKIYECGIKIGTLSEDDLKKIYVNNPIWSRPFILLEEGQIFLPIPSLIISFPFLIVERFIGDDAVLIDAYSRAKTNYLENAIENMLKIAMPSARVFTGVTWKDPNTKITWEHDVVAVLGNQIFIFEAKSGKLKPATRRGGLDSLKTNFKEIFLHPGRQAYRLESLLLEAAANSIVLKGKDGHIIELDLSSPYVIHKFAVCIEHFPGLTTSRQSFEELGLLENRSHWAPIISLAELKMIFNFLDSEVSFFII